MLSVDKFPLIIFDIKIVLDIDDQYIIIYNMIDFIELIIHQY